MHTVETIPELQQIVGALLFAAKEPVSMERLLQVFAATAEQHGGFTRDFGNVTEKLLQEAVNQLNDALAAGRTGLHIRKVANGYRLVNDANCGPWLRVLLEKGKATRLSRPALETLAIIAYRQPVVRSEIEAVRGVAVDQIIRNLLDMQLIRVVGRSELPGRPWLFGTTQTFLEHFGINSLEDLPGTAELRRLEEAQAKRSKPMDQPHHELPMSEQEEPAAHTSPPPHDLLGGEPSARLATDDDAPEEGAVTKRT